MFPIITEVKNSWKSSCCGEKRPQRFFFSREGPDLSQKKKKIHPGKACIANVLGMRQDTVPRDFAVLTDQFFHLSCEGSCCMKLLCKLQ